MRRKHVAVIGGGVTGLTAADELARYGFEVSVIEKSPFLGGVAIQLVCKATASCVKCGACLVEEKLLRASHQEHITFFTGTTIRETRFDFRIILEFETHSPLVNAERCNGCGLCLEKCPVAGTLMLGKAPRLGPYVAIRRELCRFFDNAACTLCRDTCPQDAITLTDQRYTGHLEADAVLIATGFVPFNPSDKPFGYNRFADVVTNLDAERILAEHSELKRPSDGGVPERIAFIQCVGSRDAGLGHPWCSKICCGSSIRMAGMIQNRQPDTQITVFYIDVQTFGKDFQTVYDTSKNNIRFVRAIPGDIFKKSDGQLLVAYFDPKTHESVETTFDMVILSAGLTPPRGNRDLAAMFKWPQAETGFFQSPKALTQQSPGVFVAGTAQGPLSIADCVENAGHTAWQIINYLEEGAEKKVLP